MIVFPNAKINIGLNILSRRNDGYHELETAFYPIGLKDGLEFVENGTSEINFSCSGIGLPGEMEDNLVVKAYHLIKGIFDLPGFDIHLHKAIPLGAGLGGGSADAAFFLKGLNDFFKLGISIERLTELSGSLGADCPFFINNKPSFASGIGERLKRLEPNLRGWNLVLIKPLVEVNTAVAYSKVNPRVPDVSIEELIMQPVENWMDIISNDFEKTVFPLYPQIGEIKKILLNLGASYASMSGSGSAVYGLFREVPVIDKGMFPIGTFIWEEKL